MSDAFENLVGASGGGKELVERLLASGLLSPAELAGLAPTSAAIDPAQHPTLPLGPAQNTTVAMAVAELDLPTMSLAPAHAPSSDASAPPGMPSRLSTMSIPAGSAARYRMGKVLGKGGMGEVRLATDLALGREIALKRMLDTSAQAQVRRFVMEARVTGRLEHPNIIPVHELGKGEDGAPYFTMKRVKGDSLGDLIAKLKTDFEDTRARYGITRRLHVFLGITNAISFAHSHGVLHRDLKPANVMVGEFGEVLVMDWGLVRVAGESTDELIAGVEGTLNDSGDTERTQVGSVVGTPRYMSPEQARGDNDLVDERADVFALGAILCELLALRPAIPGGTVWQVLEATTLGHRQLPGSLPKDPATPRELVAVIDKAMALDPEQRYASVAALAADVEAFLEGQVLSAVAYTPLQRLVKWGKRHKMLAVGAAASVLALVLGVGGSMSLLHQRALHQAGELLVDAQALRAARDPERAQQACIQALALDPASTPARQLLGVVSLEAEAQRRLRLREGRITELGLALERDRAALAQLDGEQDLAGWLAAQTRSFHAARELATLYGPEAGTPHRLAAAQTARAIARRMERAGEHQMATLMLAEATQLGLADEQVALDRRVMQVEASQRARRAATELERRLREATVLEPGRAPWDELLERVRHAAHPETVQVLMRKLQDGRTFAFAVEALATLGDRTTTAAVKLPPSVSVSELADETAWILADDVMTELSGNAPLDQIHEIDAPRYLALLLVRSPSVPHDIDRLVRLTNALVRLGDPRTRRALVLKRWLLGRDSLYWELTHDAVAALAEPPDQLERAKAWTAVERALYFESTGRLELAFAAYDELLAGDPSAARAVGLGGRTEIPDPIGFWATRRGRLRLLANDPDRALADAELALGRTTHTLLALRLRADVHAHAGRHAEALADFDRALAQTAHPGPLHLARARSLEALGRQDEALAAASRAADADPSCIEAYRTRARVRLATNHPDLAVVDASAALALAPTDAAALALRARAFSRLGLPLAARADLLAVDVLGDDGGRRDLDLARNIMEVACTSAGNRAGIRGAWTLAREVIARRPKSGEAHEILGRALLLDGGIELSHALEAFRAARALGHDPARMRGWEGIALVELGRYEEGAPALEEGLAVDPPIPEVLVAVARVRVADGQLDQAAQALERAAALDVRSGIALLELARLELRRNAPDRAIERLLAAADRPGTPHHRRMVIHELLINLLVGRAQQKAQKGQPREALADIELAMRYPTVFPDLRSNLARARQQLMGR